MTASSLIPTHVVEHWHREPVRIRICVGGGPAHTDIPSNSRETDINPVRIVIGTYPPSSQAGGSWAGKRGFSHCAVPAPLSGVGDARRNTTLRALVKSLQKATSRLSKGFQFLSTFLLHGNHHGASHVGKIRNYVGAENELR